MSTTSKITSSGCSACYIEELLAQGPENYNTCPTCLKNGKRKKFCTNMVVVEGNLCCCYFGDKNQISSRAFKKKIKAMKKVLKQRKQ